MAVARAMTLAMPSRGSSAFGRFCCKSPKRRLCVPGKKIAMDQEQQQKKTFSTLSNQSGSRALFDHPVEPTRMYCPAFLGSFGWGLQQLISQFVVAGVALCHIF